MYCLYPAHNHTQNSHPCGQTRNNRRCEDVRCHYQARPVNPIEAYDERPAGVNLSPGEADRRPEHGAANGAHSPPSPLSPAFTGLHSCGIPAAAAAASAKADTSAWSVLHAACRCLRTPTSGRGVEDTCGNGFDFGLRSTPHTAEHSPLLPHVPVLVLTLLPPTLVCRSRCCRHCLLGSRHAQGSRRLDEPGVSGRNSGGSGAFIVASCSAVPGRF